MSAQRSVLVGVCLVLLSTVPALGQFWTGGTVLTETNQVLTDGDTAVLAECANKSGSITTTCIQAVYSTLNEKGTMIGVEGNSSIAPTPHPQAGDALGRLGVSSGFFAQGTFYGVNGTATVEELENFDATKTSWGLGGRFDGRSAIDDTLDLDAIGTYWVGGALGRVSGTINNTPSSGAVAGIIGVDDSEGTARSYAGYFQGDGYFSNRVGIGVLNPSFALDVNGTIRGTVFVTSDVRLKEEIETLGGALDKVRSLRGVSFRWNGESSSEKQIGLVAQEVEEVLPELVITDDEGYKAVGYDKLTAVLIEAVKEQQTMLEKQQQEVAALREELRSLRSGAE